MTLLDQMLSEYLNDLFVNGAPMYLGANALSGLKKFYPTCRRSLHISSVYLKNWQTNLIRDKALPLPADLAKAMAAAAIRRGDEKFGVALLLGLPPWKPKPFSAVPL